MVSDIGPALAGLGGPLEEAFAREVAKGFAELPLLPDVAQRVLALLRTEGSSARALADLIRSDASLASHLLRIANSAVYAPRSPIVSLQQAVARLGMAEVGRVVLLIVTQTTLFHAGGFEDEVREIFDHSLVTALYAQEIARSRRTNVEEAFLAGLLHDVGRALCLQKLVDLAAELGVTPSAVAFLLAARGAHTAVGYRLVRRWALSPEVAEAVLRHHEPTASADDPPTCLVLRLADTLAHIAAGTAERSQIDHHPAAYAMNLYRDDLDALVQRGPELVAQARSLR